MTDQLINNIDTYHDLNKVLDYLQQIRKTKTDKEAKYTGYLMHIVINARVLLKP